jgi:NAD(P)-dependent dehydrogenase (short-subunit alcohol dehydrogenase family)
MTSGLNLANKCIVITGGSRGIGAAIAEMCAKAGAKVFIGARSKTEVEQTAKTLNELVAGSTQGLLCDVGDAKMLDRFMLEAAQKTGRIDGLVCAAGIYGAIGPFADRPFEEWERGIQINLVGTARSIYAALPFMKDDARVVLFSGGGQAAMPNFSSYVTSKGGIWRLTETLGAELAPKGVFVNAIAPGAVNTKFLDEIMKAGETRVGKDFFEKSLKQKASGGESPQKAAELVMYLLSSKSKGLFGKTLSALWDPYEKFTNLENLSRSDQYCMRRVVDEAGGTKAK